MMGPITVMITKNLTISTKRESFELEGASQEAAPSTFFPATLEMVVSSDTRLWDRNSVFLIPWI
jgi:hypothetical protein